MPAQVPHKNLSHTAAAHICDNDYRYHLGHHGSVLHVHDVFVTYERALSQHVVHLCSQSAEIRKAFLCEEKFSFVSS